MIRTNANRPGTGIILSLFLAASSFSLSAVAGDAEAGKAKAASCGACHGADGNSAVPSFPKLAGQGAPYLIKQMKDIKSGARPVPTMAGLLDSSSESDIADIAAYYASQTITSGVANPDLVDAGQSVYRGGNTATGVAACSACHGASGKGMPAAGFPRLAGQHAAYIEAQLKAYRAAGRNDEKGARRDNDGDIRIMRDIAARMSDSEIKAVSSYVQGLY